MTQNEIALLAAAVSWSGISAIRDRNKSVLETADKFAEWLANSGERAEW